MSARFKVLVCLLYSTSGCSFIWVLDYSSQSCFSYSLQAFSFFLNTPETISNYSLGITIYTPLSKYKQPVSVRNTFNRDIEMMALFKKKKVKTSLAVIKHHDLKLWGSLYNTRVRRIMTDMRQEGNLVQHDSVGSDGSNFSSLTSGSLF